MRDEDLARRPRRRAVLVAAAAAAGMLVVVAAGAALMRDDEPAPPLVEHRAPGTSASVAPTATPDPTPDPDTIIRTGHLASFAVGPDGALLTVWQTCTDDEFRVCHAAWSLQAPDGAVRGLLPRESPSARRAGDAFVVKAWNGKGIAITSNGEVRTLVEGEPVEVTGDLAVAPGRNGPLVADARTARTWGLPRPDGVQRWASAAIGSDGTIWASTLSGDEVQIWWTEDAAVDASWHHHTLPSVRPGNDLPGYTAVAGDHVATMSGSDGATILPVESFAVTTNGGATWVDLRRDDLPFDTVDAMAATSGGTLYVVTAGGERLYRSTDTTWTRFAEVPNPDHIGVLEPAGDHVLGQGGSYDAPVLLALDDEGGSTPVTLAR